MEHFLTFASVLLGGGILTLVQFLISRHDAKEDKKSGILQAIASLREEVKGIKAELREMIAVNSRLRILRFGDEMMRNERHSRESWDQVIEDITNYEKYCRDHEDFLNGKTIETIKFIRSNYAERLEKHDFL